MKLSVRQMSLSAADSPDSELMLTVIYIHLS